jgi:predicted small lipoprotein YifL
VRATGEPGVHARAEPKVLAIVSEIATLSWTSPSLAPCGTKSPARSPPAATSKGRPSEAGRSTEQSSEPLT